jgi:hypothetical protein
MRDLRPWALGLTIIFLVGAGEVRSFENAAAREIKGKLQGESASVSVKTKPSGLFGYLEGDLSTVTIHAKDFSADGLPLFTEPIRPKSGKVKRLNLRLENFHLSGLRVESLEAQIPNCRFDLGLAKRSKKIRLSQSGTGTGSVTLLEDDLEAFILKKFSEIKEVQVRLQDDIAIVEGKGEFLILKAAFKVQARLIAVEGTKLTLVDPKIEFDGVQADPQAAQVLLNTLNPVVDLDRDLKLHGAVSVSEIKLADGKLVASGATKIPDEPGLATSWLIRT